MTRRCYLVYAIAPHGMAASEANDLLNEYIEDERRGIVVFHDHFVGAPHGGVAVFDIGDEGALALLDDPGPLREWDIRAHPLTFSLTAVGFSAQLELTLEQYRGPTLRDLAAAEEADPRFWWRRGEG